MLELGWPLSEKAQKEIDDKKRKPSREIRVDAMRDAVEFSQRTSARGRGKAVLVYPAERMNNITANALLKTLEEPPGDVRFVLASEAAHQLLPTIRSRCLAHTLRWPAPRTGLAWLAEQGVEAAEARVLLRAAGGRPETRWRWPAPDAARGDWARLPKALARGDVAALADCTPAQAIDVLQKLCHDLLALRAAGARRGSSTPPTCPGRPRTNRSRRWWRELAQAARTAEHPFNAGLMLEALVSRARAALHSQA